MKTPPRRFPLPVLAATLAVLALPSALAQTAVTDPVGYLTTALPANSDTFVSIPFTRPAEFTGAIASASGNVITLSGTPGFTSNQFAPLGNVAPNDGHKTYYAIIGPKNVALTPTLSVTSASTTITASAALPSTLVVGDTVTIPGDPVVVGGVSTPVNHTFTVAAVPSTTSLTLDRAFPDSTKSGLSGTYNHSPNEGRFYTVTGNDTGSLTVNLNGDVIAPNQTNTTGVTAGTQVSVIPYWTLGTSFPAGDAGKSFVASTGTSPKTRQTQILMPDLLNAGVDLAVSATYYFYSGNWRLAGKDPTVSYDDDLFVTDSYFTVRNAATSSTFVPTGAVAINRLTVQLATQANNKQQDTSVAVARPLAVALKDLGLITSNAFVASTGTSPKTRTDQLFVYNNAQISQNKAPSDTYFYYQSAWRKAGQDPTTDFGSDTIPAGSGFIIRKSGTAAGATVPWQNARNYLQ